MLIKQLIIISVVLIFFMETNFAYANTLSNGNNIAKPRWELGAVIADINTPVYPASSDQHNKLLAVPYFIYRGDIISIGDKSIVSAKAVEEDFFKIDISLNAAFNAKSSDSSVRVGMPELDYLFELGPKFSFLVDKDTSSETWLDLQFRSVFSTDFSSIKHRGYIFEPKIYWQADNFLIENSKTTISISSTFATKKNHEYFYSVDTDYVTEERSLYSANSGYLGSEVTIGQNVKIDQEWNIFLGLTLNSWQGSKSEDSPLFEEKFNYSFILGVKWDFYRSNF